VERSPPNVSPPARLSVGILKQRLDRTEALQLVADSVAQQRHGAAYHLIFHPYLMAGLGACLAVAYHSAWRARRNPSATVALLVHLGLVAAYVLAIHHVAARYVRIADGIRRGDWPVAATLGSEEDLFVGVWLDSDLGGGNGTGNRRILVGALVLRLEANPFSTASAGAGGKRRGSGGGGKGIVRAWAVDPQHRRRGAGRDLLREAVRITRERCGRDARIGFAQQHAHSAPVLPRALNGLIRAEERMAARALDAVLAEWRRSKEGLGRRRVR
jgi:ribosomal protein S18 acetylase RimI-like enzyme